MPKMLLVLQEVRVVPAREATNVWELEGRVIFNCHSLSTPTHSTLQALSVRVGVHTLVPAMRVHGVSEHASRE